MIETKRTLTLKRKKIIRCNHMENDELWVNADLLEKWFICEKLGKQFWIIPSEEYYKNNQQEYYHTINLGVNFYELNYDKCLPFLEMLPNCLQ